MKKGEGGWGAIRYFKLGKNISLFIVVIFLFGITSSAFNGFLGIYVKEIGYSESVVGSLLSLRRLSVALSSICMALVGSRFGRKKAITLGLVLIGSSVFLKKKIGHALIEHSIL